MTVFSVSPEGENQSICLPSKLCELLMFAEQFIIVNSTFTVKMQRAAQTLLSHGSMLRNVVLKHVRVASQPAIFSRPISVSSVRMEEHGFESTTIADILKAKGKSADGSWLWCTTDDTVYDAVKSV